VAKQPHGPAPQDAWWRLYPACSSVEALPPQFAGALHARADVRAGLTPPVVACLSYSARDASWMSMRSKSGPEPVLNGVKERAWASG